MFNCSLCDRSFSKEFNLKRHALRVHKRRHADHENEYKDEKLEDLLDGRGVKSRVLKEYICNAQPSDVTAPYICTVEPTEDEYIDMESVYVKVKLNVTHSDGRELTEDDEEKIAPCNDLFDALFKDIEIRFGRNNENIMEIGNGGRIRPQLGMLNKLLNYDELYLESLGGSIVWQKDAPQTQNYLRWHHDHIAKSKELILCGQLFHGFYEFKSLLLPKIGMTVQLKTNPPQFSLIRAKDADTTYKINIKACSLELQRVQLIYQLAAEIRNRVELKGEIMTYPYKKMIPTMQHIAAGSTVHPQFPVILHGYSEKEGFLMFMDAVAENSKEKWENNPMIFPASKYKINYLEFFADSQPIFSKPFQPDFVKGNYAEHCTFSE